MKKFVFFISALVLSSTFAAAQEFVYFGAKGGFTFSNIYGGGFSDFEGAKTRTAYQFGVLAQIPITDKFSIQPEVLYSVQEFDLRGDGNQPDIEHQLDYIDVPVLVKYYMTTGLNLEAGPQVGFVVDEQVGAGDLFNDYGNNIEISLGLGVSWEFDNYFLYGRYNASATKLYDLPDVNARNLVVQAGLGYMF